MRQIRYIALVALFFCFVQYAKAYPLDGDIEEISVFIRVQGIGGTEINALYSYDTNDVFLPVIDLFQFLRIKYELHNEGTIISGFIVDEDKFYNIDYTNYQVDFNGKTYLLKEDELLWSDMGISMKASRYGEIFGLNVLFDFRSLSIEIATDLQLPAIREMRLEQFRRNLEQLRGEIPVDTTFFRNYHLFKFGMVDWNVTSMQSNRGSNDTRLQAGVGTELLGGETQLQLNYSSLYGHPMNNQYYLWRWANNNTPIVKQVSVGRVSHGLLSSLYSPVTGISITNAPTTYRRSFGEYTFSDYTEPGWSVELYVNNVLVDYQTADASGFYSFDIPLVYGSSQIMTKFYGPYGEERIKEQFLNVPYNFLPRGEVEYNIVGGLVWDDEKSKFGRASVSCGVNRWISAGAGIEHLSSIPGNPDIPFFSLAVRPAGFLMLSGEHADGVRSRLLMNVRLPSGMGLETNFAKYVKGQKAIYFNYLEEWIGAFTSPLKFFELKGFSRVSFRRNVYEFLSHNMADLTISSYFRNFSFNISTYGNWIDNYKPYLFGNITAGIRFGKGYTFRPQGQFDFTNGNLVLLRLEAEKRITQMGYISLSGEENYRSKISSVNFNFRWSLPFAQAGLSARYSGSEIVASQSAGGSFSFGSGNRYVHTDNRSATGRGGVSVIPFLDLNHNDTHDIGEPLVSGLTVRMTGGRMLNDRNDTIVRIVELEPYTSYVLTLDDASLEEISWLLEKKFIRVYIDPNQFKKVYIPVKPMGEANGMVAVEDERGVHGQGRVLLNFYSEDGGFISRVMTESDGSFTFLGLPPGKIIVKPDSTQLENIKMISNPPEIEFELREDLYGDIIYDLDFTLKRIAGDPRKSSSKIERKEESDSHEITIKPDIETMAEAKEQEKSTDVKTVDLTAEGDEDLNIKIDFKGEPKVTAKSDISSAKEKIDQKYYRIQLLALSRQLNFNEYFKELMIKVPTLTVEELIEGDNLYRYSSQPLFRFSEAVLLRQQITDSGWSDCYLRPYNK